MLTAEVLETILYGCFTWSPRACHYDTLRRAHHRFFTRRIGWQKHNRADHPISYLDTLIKTGTESIEATLRRRRILFAGFVARMEDMRLPKCVMFGELVGDAGCVRGQGKEWMALVELCRTGTRLLGERGLNLLFLEELTSGALRILRCGWFTSRSLTAFSSPKSWSNSQCIHYRAAPSQNSIGNICSQLNVSTCFPRWMVILFSMNSKIGFDSEPNGSCEIF